MGWVLAAVGVFAICGATFEWGFFMNHRKARFLVSLFGRTAARIIYMALGAGLVVTGLLIGMGVVQKAAG